MAKGYWIAFYRSVSDEEALKAYAARAAEIFAAAGGRFVARGTAVKAYEGGPPHRTVVIEFDSVEAAIATYEGAAYQAAAAGIKGKVERELRIVPGA